jgi:membrane-associated phospholipid phosphatase
MALTSVDKLLAAYVTFATVMLAARGEWTPSAFGLLVMHLLFGVLLWAFTRPGADTPLGRSIHALYPLFLLLPFYAGIGIINDPVGRSTVLANDAVVQGWEAALFGQQISYTWLRAQPSIFWSAVFHLAYFAYYPIVVLGPVFLVMRGRLDAARYVMLATMIAFVICYVVFILYPVAGPYYAFDQPTGPVREVWSARLVYAVLAGGSSFGAAFPSSHVGATLASVLALWRVRPAMGRAFMIPAILLTVGTVYCQMHYGIDAISGVAVGAVAFVAAGRFQESREFTARGTEARRPSGTANAEQPPPDGKVHDRLHK